MTTAGPSPRAPVRDGLTLMVACALIVLMAAVGLTGGVVGADRATVDVLHDHAFPELTRVAVAITDLGGTAVVAWLCAFGAVALCWRRQWGSACALVTSVAATQLVVALVKGAVQRPRPAGSEALVHAAGSAFPSGHAATAAALYGALALIAHDRLSGRPRALAVGAALTLALMIGVTRVYLGAHYPTDVLAGWLLGSAVAAASWWAAGRLRTSPTLQPAPA